jgi:hypothetical protein
VARQIAQVSHELSGENLGKQAGVREIVWKEVKVPVDFIPKAHIWLADRARARSAKLRLRRAGGVYCCGLGCQNGNPG